MTDSSNSERIGRDVYASLIAREVERALLRHDGDIQPPLLTSAGQIAGMVAAAVAFLPATHQQAVFAIQHRLPDLASEFIRVLAADAMRRLDGSAAESGTAFLAAAATEADEPAIPTAPGRDDALDSMLIEEWAGNVAGQTHLEKKLRIPRSTLHIWKRRNEVVALRSGRCKHVFPLAQFVDGRPAPGIRDVLSIISNRRLAWFWLSNPCPDLDGRVPIELLKQELVAEVISAARKFVAGTQSA